MSLSSPRKSAAGFKLLTYSRLDGQQPRPAAATPGANPLRLPDFGSAEPPPTPQEGGFKGMEFPRYRPAETNPAASREAARAAEELRARILREAEAEAEAIRESARREAEKIRRQAEEETAARREEFAAEARREGREEAEREKQKHLKQLDTLLARLATVYQCCRRDYEKELVDLALNCARRLVNREIERDTTVILDCIEEVFAESNLRGEITLRLNPEDIAIVEERREQLLTDFPGLEKLRLEAGSGIERGGCLLESPLGRIDATLAGKFEELQHLLREKPHSDPAP